VTSRPYFDQANVLYVGQGGSDVRDGKSAPQRFLTIAAAIAAAVAATPGPANKFRIVIVDAGVYTENLTIPAWVMVDGPQATVNGNHTLAGNCGIRIHRNDISSGIGFHLLPPPFDPGFVEVDYMVLSGTAIGFQTTGFLLHVKVHSITHSGTGSCVGGASTGKINLIANEINHFGAGGFGVGATGLGGAVRGTINALLAAAGADAIRISGPGPLGGGFLNVRNLDATGFNAYNIGLGDTLWIQVGRLSGTRFVAPGGAYHETEAGKIGKDENDINTLPVKATPVAGDLLLLEDSASLPAFQKRKVDALSIPPAVHALGGASHTPSTLAALNALITGAAVDDQGNSRVMQPEDTESSPTNFTTVAETDLWSRTIAASKMRADRTMVFYCTVRAIRLTGNVTLRAYFGGTEFSRMAFGTGSTPIFIHFWGYMYGLAAAEQRSECFARAVAPASGGNDGNVVGQAPSSTLVNHLRTTVNGAVNQIFKVTGAWDSATGSDGTFYAGRVWFIDT